MDKSFVISRRVKLVCKLMFPQIDTHRTRFDLTDMMYVRVPVYRHIEERVGTYFYENDVCVFLTEYNVVTIQRMYLQARKSTVVLSVGYDAETDVCLVYYKQPVNWYWYHGGQRYEYKV